MPRQLYSFPYVLPGVTIWFTRGDTRRPMPSGIARAWSALFGRRHGSGHFSSPSGIARVRGPYNIRDGSGEGHYSYCVFATSGIARWRYGSLIDLVMIYLSYLYVYYLVIYSFVYRLCLSICLIGLFVYLNLIETLYMNYICYP